MVYDVRHAFRFEDQPRDVEILNSTIDSTGEQAVFRSVEGNPINPTLENLLFVGLDVPRFAAKFSSNQAQPKSAFVDPDNHDYHLLPGSTALDSGKSLSSVELDRDGRKRPQGSGHDVGAYEARQEP